MPQESHDGRDDDEYELGWTEHIDQRLDREGDDERELDPTDYDFPGFIEAGQGM